MYLKYVLSCLALGSIAANISACASTGVDSEPRLYFKSHANEFEIGTTIWNVSKRPRPRATSFGTSGERSLGDPGIRIEQRVCDQLAGSHHQDGCVNFRRQRPTKPLS